MKIKFFSLFLFAFSFPVFVSFGFPLEGTCDELKSSALDGIYEAIQTNALTRQYIDQNYADLNSLDTAILQAGDSQKYRSYLNSLRQDDVYMQSQALYTETYLNSLFSSVNRFDCSESCDSPTNECCEIVVQKLQGITDIMSILQNQISFSQQYLSKIEEYTYYIRSYAYSTALAMMSATNSLGNIDQNVGSISYDTYLLQTDLDWLITHFYPILKSIDENISNSYQTVNLVLTNDLTVIVTNNTDVSSIVSAINSAKVYLETIDDNVTLIQEDVEYMAFLLEHGFGSTTNILSSIDEKLSPITNKPSFVQLILPSLTVDGIRFLRGNGNFVTQSSANLTSVTKFDKDNFYNNLMRFFYNQNNIGYSINNILGFTYRDVIPAFTNTLSAIHQDQTNYFSFFRGEIGVRGVLEDWQSEEVSGTYHDFLTNHYLSVVFGDQLSGNQAEKTNWFSRVETLLAALVFVDGSDTNAYKSASEASSNSVNTVKDRFNSIFDGVSSAPSSQMELAEDIEKSMYESLRTFSSAFSSASLPSTVRLLYVHKDGGGGGSFSKGSSRSSSGSVDVTVDVDGKLADFIEILRSCSTLCWVFFGLWFMFKFTVWTVKKIYVLIRYIIDFFNMVAGGK